MKIRVPIILLIISILLGLKSTAQSSAFVNARNLFEKGNYEQAEKLFNIFGKNSVEYADTRFYLGQICHSRREFDKAIAFFQEAIKMNNKNAGYYFWLGNSYGEKAMQSNIIKKGFLAKKIIYNWEIAAKLDLNHLQLRCSMVDFYSQVPSFLGGDKERAYSVADEIKRINLSEGYHAKAFVYERDNQNNMAEWNFKAAIKQSPKEIKFYYSLASFYMRQQKTVRAIETYEEIIVVDPKESKAFLEIGRICCVSVKMADTGVNYLTRYLEIAEDKNSRTSANFYLGNIYNFKNDKVNARKFYIEALSIDPTFKDARKAIEQLNK